MSKYKETCDFDRGYATGKYNTFIDVLRVVQDNDKNTAIKMIKELQEKHRRKQCL